MLICQHCNKECKNPNSLRNHERLCPSNMSRVYKSRTLGKTPWNKGKTKYSDPIIAQHAVFMKESYLNGKRVTAGAALWSKKKRSEVAKIKGCGGYRENAGRSKKYKVVDSFGKVTTLQSSFELRCCKLLEEMKISWIRPKALKYDGRNYFADFFLTDYNIYLDPKNAYKARIDKVKINKVIEQNKVTLFVLLEEQLTKEYIASLVQ